MTYLLTQREDCMIYGADNKVPGELLNVVNLDLKIPRWHNNWRGQDTLIYRPFTLSFPHLLSFLSLWVFLFQTMADRFQKEISTAMRSENNAFIHYQLLLIGVKYVFFLKMSSACGFLDKLTGVLPFLSPGVRGVPLPKVAAHVTGVISSTEPPTADGEDPRW